jgi:hypothetical protein
LWKLRPEIAILPFSLQWEQCSRHFILNIHDYDSDLWTENHNNSWKLASKNICSTLKNNFNMFHQKAVVLAVRNFNWDPLPAKPVLFLKSEVGGRGGGYKSIASG